MTTLEKIKAALGDVVWRQFGIIPTDDDTDRLCQAALQPLLPPDEGTIEAMRSAYLVTTPEGLADTDMAAAWKAGLDHIRKDGEL